MVNPKEKNSRIVFGDKARNFVKSLSRGFSVLEALAQAQNPLTLSEIARSVGIKNVTATRFCYTLAQLGFISRDSQLRYHITPRVLSFGYAAIRGLDWQKVAHFYLDQLSKDTRETVNMSVLSGDEILYLIRIKTEKILPFDLQIGSKLPVYCTSMGKVLMAFVSEKKIRPILSRLHFRSLTHRTITGFKEYQKELGLTKRRGYAINDEELSVGLRSAAAPIRDAHGSTIAAINIAVPTKRFSRIALENLLVPKLVETAEEISRALRDMEWISVSEKRGNDYDGR